MPLVGVCWRESVLKKLGGCLLSLSMCKINYILFHPWKKEGCKGERATFSGLEYILLLQGGRRVSTNMETTLKIV
jgi:hypothetical protein